MRYCTICGKGFFFRCNLNKHLKGTHPFKKKKWVHERPVNHYSWPMTKLNEPQLDNVPVSQTEDSKLEITPVAVDTTPAEEPWRGQGGEFSGGGASGSWDSGSSDSPPADSSMADAFNSGNDGTSGGV